MLPTLFRRINSVEVTHTLRILPLLEALEGSKLYKSAVNVESCTLFRCFIHAF